MKIGDFPTYSRQKIRILPVPALPEKRVLELSDRHTTNSSTQTASLRVSSMRSVVAEEGNKKRRKGRWVQVATIPIHAP